MKQSYSVIMKFLNTVDTKRLFVESDAWWLFKYSALSEVIGWTLLIYGIVAPYYHLPGFTFMLAIGGSIHGMLFIAYIGILAATYTSLGWTRGKVLIGFFVSALPYGTFFFEQWANHIRRQSQLGSYRRVVVRAVIQKKEALLALQASNSVTWQLPGGYIEGSETPELALSRIIKSLTGIVPSVDKFLSTQQTNYNGEPTLELSYAVSNPDDFNILNLDKIVKGQGDIDEMQFINARQAPELISHLFE